MKSTRYAISWIYGQFRITRLQRGFPLQRWTADFAVDDLSSLSKAMGEACNHIDLTHGGDVAIAYESDLHTHEFLEVPQMSKKDLEKMLARKAAHDKPFEDKAAWCYHDAKHGDKADGIMLHMMPQHVVDSIIRISQEFYLTPRRLVPLSEIVSARTVSYPVQKTDWLLVVALFVRRTEILLTLGSGEILFVRELPFSAYGEGQTRLQVEINRTTRYAKQQFGTLIDEVWLVGEKADQVQNTLQGDNDVPIKYDQDSLDPMFWATQAASLSDNLLSNFIPLLARKKINRQMFYRLALWSGMLLLLAAVTITNLVEILLNRQNIDREKIQNEVSHLNHEISQINELIKRADEGRQKLQLLQADEKNLPALFTGYLGDMLPDSLVLLSTQVIRQQNGWQVTLKGQTSQKFDTAAPSLEQLETTLQAPPWNMSVSRSWKEGWYEQLKTGAALNSSEIGFEIEGWLR